MLASFILSFIAGFLTVYVEGPLKAGLERLGGPELNLDDKELRVLTFGLMLLLAAIGVALWGRDSSAYMAVAGGLLGYFAGDLYAFARDPNKSAGDEDDEWDGVVAGPGGRFPVADHQVVPPAPAAAGDTEDDAEATMRAVKDAVREEAAGGEEPREEEKQK